MINMSHQTKIYAAFFIYSLTLGSIFPYFGELIMKLNVDKTTFGLGLLGLALGAQISLMFAGTAFSLTNINHNN